MNWENILQTVINWLTTAGIKVVIALILLFVSFKLINWFSKKIEKASEKNTTSNMKYDKTLTRTLSNILRILLKVIVCACLVGYLGLDTSGITALIASLGVGVGLAVAVMRVRCRAYADILAVELNVVDSLEHRRALVSGKHGG